jgi:hypothetical protein
VFVMPRAVFSADQTNAAPYVPPLVLGHVATSNDIYMTQPI